MRAGRNHWREFEVTAHDLGYIFGTIVFFVIVVVIVIWLARRLISRRP